jgi:protein CpxP
VDQPEEKDSLIALINERQRMIEEAHFEHFRSIRGLCEKEQIAKFDELSKELGTIFRPPMPPGKK